MYLNLCFYAGFLIIFFSEIEPCTPNPCQHGGTCLTNEDRSYVCNCSGTMYSGENCHIGVISIPNYPQFYVNAEYNFTVKAKPDRSLVLIFNPDDNDSVTIEPKILKFNTAVTENNFTISVTNSSLFKLDYILTSTSASNFLKPPPSTIIVLDRQAAESDYFAEKRLQKGVVQAGCHFLSLNYNCKFSSNYVKFIATCPWDEKKKESYSSGIVFSNNNGLHFPIAIAGAKLYSSTFSLSSLSTHELRTQQCESGEQEVSKGFESIGLLPDEQCNTYKPSKHPTTVNSFLTLETLAHTFFYHSHELLPQWLNFNVTSTDRKHDVNSYMVTLVESTGIETLKSCHLTKTYSEGLYSVLVYYGLLNITINSKMLFYQPGPQPVCFAINLCDGVLSPVYISIPDDSIELISELGFMKKFKNSNWHISVKSLVITNGIIPFALRDTYWNGINNFVVDSKQINLILNGEIFYSFAISEFNVKYEFSGEIYLHTADSIDAVCCAFALY